MKNIKYILILFSSICVAQNKFEIKKGSEKYTAEISVENCNATNCEGKATIKLIDKKTNHVFQTFTSDDLRFQIADKQSALIFEDFNFDGSEDLAIVNGYGAYGEFAYDVYVYNSTKKQLVLNKELTDLATSNVGMFKTDKKRKRIITFYRSGLNENLTTEYKVIPNKGLEKTYQVHEYTPLNNKQEPDEFTTVTTGKLVNNKWQSESQKYKTSEYHKDWF